MVGAKKFQFLTGSISKPTEEVDDDPDCAPCVSVPHRFDKQADVYGGHCPAPSCFVSVPHRFDKQADDGM